MSDEAKVRFLFRKVQHEGLRNLIKALKALERTGAVITCTMAANHLSTVVSLLLEYLAKNVRNVSAAQFKNNRTVGGGIHNEDRSIMTRNFLHWASLSHEQKKIVIAERKHLGIQ